MSHQHQLNPVNWITLEKQFHGKSPIRAPRSDKSAAMDVFKVSIHPHSLSPSSRERRGQLVPKTDKNKGNEIFTHPRRFCAIFSAWWRPPRQSCPQTHPARRPSWGNSVFSWKVHPLYGCKLSNFLSAPWYSAICSTRVPWWLWALCKFIGICSTESRFVNKENRKLFIKIASDFDDT